ncbi:MAG: hypothetical protein SNI36_06270 [Rikenellaceae bacterium]
MANFYINGQSTTDAVFGLCDNQPPAKTPAYIDSTTREIWIAEINNTNGINIDFYAIDNNVVLYRPDRSFAKRCDGMLKYQSKIHFIELKDRGSKCVRKGRRQIEETIEHFAINHPDEQSLLSDCYICNKQLFEEIAFDDILEFKNRTANILKSNGLTLNINRIIVI